MTSRIMQISLGGCYPLRLNTFLDIHQMKLRDGPLEITGGGVKNFWCMNFFKKPSCLQEFFSRAYDLLFLGITACWIFLDKFPLQEFFFMEIVTPPVV